MPVRLISSASITTSPVSAGWIIAPNDTPAGRFRIIADIDISIPSRCACLPRRRRGSGLCLWKPGNDIICLWLSRKCILTQTARIRCAGFWKSGRRPKMRSSKGVDMRAVTVWALLGSYDWNCLVTARNGILRVRSVRRSLENAAQSPAVWIAHARPGCGTAGFSSGIERGRDGGAERAAPMFRRLPQAPPLPHFPYPFPPRFIPSIIRRVK